MKPKVMVIGLDGATFDLIMPWIKDGKLSTLNDLISRGASGNLETVFPPNTGPAWPSLTSGKNPAKNGCFYFIQKNNVISSRDLTSERIWKNLSKRGKRCGVINVPITYPHEKVNGVLVSSFLTPPGSRDYVYPPKMIKYFESNGYKICPEFENYGDVMDRLNKRKMLLAEIHDVFDKRFVVLMELLEDDWDFFMFNLKSIDDVQHFFWDKENVIFDFWTKLDKYLDDIIKKFRGTCIKNNALPYIFVVSDHGFGPTPPKTFNLRFWMEKKGYIKKSSKYKRKLASLYIKFRLNGTEKIPFFSDLIGKFRKMEVKDSYNKSTGIRYVNYGGSGGIFVGDPETRKNLISDLENIKDSDGRHIFQWAKKREELYSGEYLKKAPHINILPKWPYRVGYSFVPKLIYDTILKLPGGHDIYLNGILIANGKGIKKCKINAKITDLVPTILHLFGMPISMDMDGKALKNIFDEKSRFYKLNVKCSRGSKTKKTKKSNFYSESDEKTIKERLKSLGYV